MEKVGWTGPVTKFVTITISDFLDSLQKHNLNCVNVNPSFLQIKAWEHEYQILQKELPLLIQANGRALDWYLVFEYELPRERGRRPDIIVIADDRIFIIECKDMKRWEQQHIDQLTSYVRDLSNYHQGSTNIHFVPLLLMTLLEEAKIETHGITIISPDQLHSILNVQSSVRSIDPQEWIESRYAPLPSLITAAKMIFDHEPLPRIKKAESLGVNDAVDELVKISEIAMKNGEHHLALVTGVPGSGKTLVGLQLVYRLQNNDVSPIAVFLSGNGPLVKVLQYTLKSKVFVQDVHGFLKEYGGNSPYVPQERVVVFDEAQRAWDSERVNGVRNVQISEPQDFLSIGEKGTHGSLMVGLIGEGQEIHIGEESGIAQWNDAIAKSPGKWIVHCPEKIAPMFKNAERVVINDSLNLTITLRSHLVEDVDKWVEALLDGDFERAKYFAINIKQANFNLYVTQDFDVAKRYVRERYQGYEEKRYGLICSSKADNLSSYGINNDFYAMQRLQIGPWFNDHPNSAKSCCNLTSPTTEFQCQGLELDMPIICWGDDLFFDQKWNKKNRVRGKLKDPLKVTTNCYRVLLTRGRDGIVIFVPEDGTRKTFDVLVEAGAEILFGFQEMESTEEYVLSGAALDIKRDE